MQRGGQAVCFFLAAVHRLPLPRGELTFTEGIRPSSGLEQFPEYTAWGRATLTSSREQHRSQVREERDRNCRNRVPGYLVGSVTAIHNPWWKLLDWEGLEKVLPSEDTTNKKQRNLWNLYSSQHPKTVEIAKKINKYKQKLDLYHACIWTLDFLNIGLANGRLLVGN